MSGVERHPQTPGAGPGVAPSWPGPVRGREAEWGLVADLLERTVCGSSGVLLVEGEPGIGKSMLLAAAADAAADRGFSVAAGAADELSRFTPLAPLLTALAEPKDAGIDAGCSPGGASIPNIWARLEELASAGPVLASFDDVHLADPGTLGALRRLPRLLAPYRLSWILAGRTQGWQDALLFDLLEGEGAVRLCLEPLAGEGQAALMADILGAVPDTALCELAASASGNPSMLTQLLRGLIDEDAVAVSGDRAALVSPRVPRRIRSMVQERLSRLSPRTRQLLGTGSVLGRSFRLEDAAAMLSVSPGALLGSVDEALAAGVVVATRAAIAFEQDLVWQAVTEAMAPPVREALHRQAGEMLLARRGSAVPAAHHLLVGARHGDPVVLAGLDRAVADTLPSAPHAAAELAVRALELTSRPDAGHAARTVTAVKALVAAARWDEAGALARSALAVPMPARETTQLRCEMSAIQAISGRPADALAGAEAILADPHLPREIRDDAELVLLQALTGLHDNHKAAEVASAILSRPDSNANGRETTVVAALLVLALVMWDAGRAGRALDLASQAVRAETTAPPHARRFRPDLFLASRLVDLRQHTGAEAILNQVDRAAGPGTGTGPAASPDLLRARMALAAGQLDLAAAEAAAVLGDRAISASRPNGSAALLILGTVALRRGDLNAARGHLDGLPAPVPGPFEAAYEANWRALVAAQIVEASSGPRAAADGLASLYAGLDQHRYLLMSHPASAAWLVRVALAAGDTGRAEAAAAVMAQIHYDNTGIPVYRACAEHAHGVLAHDRQSLEQAVALHDDPWARASAAEDLASLLALTSPREAIRCLDAALDWTTGIGAERDAARIRRRLRRLGVRRRHWRSAHRPATGWDSLTDTERSTSELVAQGLTNQQVADQLFISVHTVAFHLRQVFRKLGIGSRVELARIALERSAGREPDTPGSSLISPVPAPARPRAHPCPQDTRPGPKAIHRKLYGAGRHRGGRRRVWTRGRRSRRGS